MAIFGDKHSRLELIASQIDTSGEARAVIGAATKQLQKGYELLADLPGGNDDDGDNVRGAARSLLDQANEYAGRIYGQFPALTLSAPISETQRLHVANILRSSLRAVDLVADAAKVDYWDFTGAIEAVLGSTVSPLLDAGKQGLFAVVLAALKSLWPVLLVLAILLVIAARVRR
jgi:hypothetical protein